LHAAALRKVSKRFFFEKKKQKTFGPAGVGTRSSQPAVNEVFLLLFVHKKKRFLLGRHFCYGVAKYVWDTCITGDE
jgi:hypothetical protein